MSADWRLMQISRHEAKAIDREGEWLRSETGRNTIIEECAIAASAPLTYAGPDPQGIQDLRYLMVEAIRALKTAAPHPAGTTPSSASVAENSGADAAVPFEPISKAVINDAILKRYRGEVGTPSAVARTPDARRLLEEAAERISTQIALNDDGRTDPLLADIYAYLNGAPSPVRETYELEHHGRALRQCSCGFPNRSPCNRTQTDCVMYSPRPHGGDKP